MDSIVAANKMLAGPENYKVLKSTIQRVLEQEDLWDAVNPQLSDTTSAESPEISKSSQVSNSKDPASPSITSRSDPLETEKICRKKTKAMCI